MTKIIKDIGLVLKKKDYRESSNIVILYSKLNGKLDLIVKGIRKPNNKLTAVLEPFNIIEFVFYKKNNRDIQFLSSAEFVQDFNNIKNNLEKLNSFFLILEILNRLTHESENSEAIFKLTLDTALRINYTNNDPDIFLIQFLYTFLEINGLNFITKNCPLCNKSYADERRLAYSNQYGIICYDCLVKIKNGKSIDDITGEALLTLKIMNLDYLENITIKSEILSKIKLILFDFIAIHFELNEKIKYNFFK